MNWQKKKIILASTSPRRKELLQQIDLEFSVDPSAYEEDNSLNMLPHDLVKHFSQQKAQDVAKRHTDAIIIGADTIVALDNTVLGKPKDINDAENMLQKLSGKSHSVLTGLTIIDTKLQKERCIVEETIVTFRKLRREEIHHYITTYKPLDKAGAYGIQEYAGCFVERVDGDYFNIVGLPLAALIKMLHEINEAHV